MRFGRGATAERQPGVGQLVECAVEVGLGCGSHRSQEFVAELPPDRRANLRDLFGGSKPIQPRHQGILQRGRNCEYARRLNGPKRLNGLQDCFRQFFHKQRHAVSLGQDLPEQLGGKRFPAGELGDDRAALRARELGEVQRRHMAVPRPARLELRPMGEHDQQRDGSHPVDQQIEHFQAGGIGPVRILEQHHGGLFRGGRFGEIDQRSQRLVLVFLRRHGERPVPLLTRNRQHRGEEAHVFESGVRSVSTTSASSLSSLDSGVSSRPNFSVRSKLSMIG